MVSILFLVLVFWTDDLSSDAVIVRRRFLTPCEAKTLARHIIRETGSSESKDFFARPNLRLLPHILQLAINCHLNTFVSFITVDDVSIVYNWWAAVAHPLLLTVWMSTSVALVRCFLWPLMNHRCSCLGFFIEILKNAPVNVPKLNAPCVKRS